MDTIVKATFTNGIFKPLKDLDLPEGQEVMLTVTDISEGVGVKLTRQEVFAQVLANRITSCVGMAEIIEEDKMEQEEHPDTWLRS
ncbi:antitoxin family protein [Candidatus Poribacteria bacterium]|nr:antitoxin family protein [Candidatus Poribacteria bacterium]